VEFLLIAELLEGSVLLGGDGWVGAYIGGGGGGHGGTCSQGRRSGRGRIPDSCRMTEIRDGLFLVDDTTVSRRHLSAHGEQPSETRYIAG